MRRSCPVVPLLIFAVFATAQQYPPQYPPGQYPPGQYPPGQYPPNQYPTRLPGGIPVNLPVPEVKLPKRQTKNEKSGDSLKVTLASVDGTLRKVGEKDLLLQTAKKNVLRFRLLPKTQFRDKEGQPIRDSLLHAGDQLTVHVNTDDEETALRVILNRAGTSSERAAAEHPVDLNSVRAPRAEDLSKPRSVRVDEASPTDAPAEAPAEEAAAPARPDARLDTDLQVIRDAREAGSSFSAGLPNFLVSQSTVRYFSSGIPARWQKIDEVTAEVAVVDGKEDYRNVMINGQPALHPVERTGAWSTGEFSTTLDDVLSVGTNAQWKRRGEDRVADRPALVFDYTVEQANSHWTLSAPDGRQYNPAFEGAVWIDRESRRVLRIEQRSRAVPREFPFSKAECILEYGFVKINGKPYLMPVSSENIGCMSGSGACSRNVITFRDYRKFSVESVLKFAQ